MSEIINTAAMEGNNTGIETLIDGGNSYETSLVETGVVDATKTGLSTGAKTFIGGLIGFGIGVAAKTAFDVIRAIKMAKKIAAEEEAKKMKEKEENQSEEEVKETE